MQFGSRLRWRKTHRNGFWEWYFLAPWNRDLIEPFRPLRPDQYFFWARPSLMKTIRTLVANRPRLTRDLVSAMIADKPNIEVIGKIEDGGEIEKLVDLKHTDILVVELGEANGIRSAFRSTTPRRGAGGFDLRNKNLSATTLSMAR